MVSKGLPNLIQPPWRPIEAALSKILQIISIYITPDVIKSVVFWNNDTTSKSFITYKLCLYTFALMSNFCTHRSLFLDVVSLFLKTPLLITSGVFLKYFFLIITLNLKPWCGSFTIFYDLALLGSFWSLWPWK